MGRPLKEVLEAQRKYGYGGPKCMVCGQPTDSVSIKCESCMEKARHAGELDFARDWLSLHPNPAIELAHDKRKRVHLVTFRDSQLAWCGERVSQLKAKRVKVVREKFPAGLCAECYTAFVEASI